MDKTVIIILVAAVVAFIAIGAAVWMYLQKRRTEKLRYRFGPEYERVVEQDGDRRRAEAVLEERQKRVEKFELRPLSTEDRQRFSGEWTQQQARFVDDPSGAVADADLLIREVMKTRGYPVGDFEQRTADISVDHPRVVENYRIAHDIAVRDSRGEAGTEDLRKAMVHYRALFEELLETQAAAAKGGRK
jgi:hypothetical protein